MVSLQRLAAAGALAATFTLAGCSDSLSPDTVDPQALNGNVNNLVYTFESNAAFVSMRSLSSNFPAYNATALVRAAAAALDIAAHPNAPAALGQARLLASLHGVTGTDALFPINVLGKTLVWDADSNGYVVSALAGAPANGIRLVLYVADPNTGTPFLPLQPIGNLDLTDESSPADNKVGVLVKIGGLTVADYDITAVIATNAVTVTAAGYVKSGDGSDQANFNISLNATQSALTIHVVIVGSDGTAVEVTGTITGTTVTFDFSVARDHNTIAIHAVETLSTSSVAGNIKFNGTIVALISGPSDNPTFTPSEGFNLTGEDIQTLLQLFAQIGEFVGKFIDGVFAPAGIVFGAGLSL